RRPDERRSVVGRNVQVDVLKSVVFAVPRIQVDDLNSDAHKTCSLQVTRVAAYSCFRGPDRTENLKPLPDGAGRGAHGPNAIPRRIRPEDAPSQGRLRR